MLFNSLQFLFFFIFVTSAYFLLHKKYRWILLLAASCYFYMIFKPIYIFILAFTIFVDYFAGLLIEKSSGARRKLFLVASICANVGVLAVFKYYNFISFNLSLLLHPFNWPNPLSTLSMLLPIGLSFHTFQAMSYTIEVYRGHQKAERHLGIYSLYVMFYPQLVAGPIERPQNLLYQLKETHDFNYERLKSGLLQMAEGLFKKAVIADRLALVVNDAYANVENENGLTLFVATIFFAFQIYCDFSGYSDMAIGAARIMGISLMKNFNAPYLSKSIREFWQRWHISLSTWFRDYVYVPLGGNRVSEPRLYVNLLIVFALSGLWHGANWTFVIWGGLNGLYLITETLIRKHIPSFKLPAILQWILTFVLICLTWIFFRSANVSDAFEVIKRIASSSFSQTVHTPYSFGEMLFCWLLVLFLLLKEKFQVTPPVSSTRLFYPYLAGVVLLTYLLGFFNYAQFIYFQF